MVPFSSVVFCCLNNCGPQRVCVMLIVLSACSCTCVYMYMYVQCPFVVVQCHGSCSIDVHDEKARMVLERL